VKPLNLKHPLKLVFALTLSLGIFQHTGIANTSETADTNEKPDSKPLYSTYKPNYVLLRSRRDGDDAAMAVRLSGRYQYLNCDDLQDTWFCKTFTFGTKYANLKSFLSYTHDFDFYLWGNSTLGRQSEPVVNRMTSPALHFEWTPENAWPDENNRWKIGSRMLSLVHHSNGQSLDRLSTFGNISDEDLPRAIERLETRNPAWRDNISRSWNYLEAKIRLSRLHWIDEQHNKDCKTHLGCGNFFIAGKRRVFWIDDEIWWEPGNRSKLSDYNLLEVTYSNEFQRPIENKSRLRSGEFNLTLSCGTQGCGANAWTRLNLKWPFPNLELPWMLYVRGGPNEHFYNYHEDTFNAGIGFQFRP